MPHSRSSPPQFEPKIMSKSCDGGREMNPGWGRFGNAYQTSFAPPPRLEPSPSGKRELIVLADDNADMRQYLTRLLTFHLSLPAAVPGH